MCNEKIQVIIFRRCLLRIVYSLIRQFTRSKAVDELKKQQILITADVIHRVKG